MRVRDLIPALCAGCGCPGDVLCERCIAFVRGASVPATGTRLGERLIALGPYEGPLRGAVHALKYREATAVAARLGELLADECRRELGPIGVREVVSVPTARARRQERGYDQAELLADAVASCLGVGHRRVLVRRLRARPQTALDAEARRKLPRHLFSLDFIPDSHVLLVDDVVTTGTTMSTAKRTLECAGCSVTCACVAMTRRRRGGRRPSVP